MFNRIAYYFINFTDQCVIVSMSEKHQLGELFGKYIKWPTREEARITSNHIYRKYGFPNVNASLKGRFRSLLDKLPLKRTDLIPYYVIACCILHNICIMKDDLIDIPIFVNHEIPGMDVDIEMNNDMKVAGMEKRERLKNFINNNV